MTQIVSKPALPPAVVPQPVPAWAMLLQLQEKLRHIHVVSANTHLQHACVAGSVYMQASSVV